jgi:hypothetical protein
VVPDLGGVEEPCKLEVGAAASATQDRPVTPRARDGYELRERLRERGLAGLDYRFLRRLERACSADPTVRPPCSARGM